MNTRLMFWGVLGAWIVTAGALAGEAARRGPSEKDVRALAKRVSRQGRSWTIEYARYHIRTTVSREFTAALALHLRQFRQAYHSFLRPRVIVRTIPKVVVFKTRAEYAREMLAQGKPGLATAAGCYIPRAKSSTIYTFIDQPEGARDFAHFDLSAINHEGAHQRLGLQVGYHRTPIWFDEGVATFFENWDVYASTQENLAAYASPRSPRLLTIARTFGTKDFLPLRTLMSLTPDTWAPATAPVDLGYRHYAEAQSFMTFLLTTKPGREFFSRIFNRVKKTPRARLTFSPKLYRRAQAAWYQDIRRRLQDLRKMLGGTPREEP